MMTLTRNEIMARSIAALSSVVAIVPLLLLTAYYEPALLTKIADNQIAAFATVFGTIISIMVWSQVVWRFVYSIFERSP